MNSEMKKKLKYLTVWRKRHQQPRQLSKSELIKQAAREIAAKIIAELNLPELLNDE